MKKKLIPLLLLALIAFLTACSDKAPEQVSTTIQATTKSTQIDNSNITSVPTPSVTPTPKSWWYIRKPDPSSHDTFDQRIKKLIQQNMVIRDAYCTEKGLQTKIKSISSDGYLEYTPIYGDVYEVDEEYCPDYATFEAYVRDTYVDKESNLLLTSGLDSKLDSLVDGYGRPKYFEYKGKFCKDETVGYNFFFPVDFEDFKYNLSKIDKKTYDLTITAYTGLYPGQTRTPYEIKTKLIMEDGVWKLEKMLIENWQSGEPPIS